MLSVHVSCSTIGIVSSREIMTNAFEALSYRMSVRRCKKRLLGLTPSSSAMSLAGRNILCFGNSFRGGRSRDSESFSPAWEVIGFKRTVTASNS